MLVLNTPTLVTLKMYVVYLIHMVTKKYYEAYPNYFKLSYRCKYNKGNLIIGFMIKFILGSLAKGN